MPPAPLPPDEARRLVALQRLQALDTPAEPVFDALVRSASLVCDMPISLISLIDSERQWFKANIGLPAVSETPRDVAFCTHTILSDGMLEVPNALLDPRFADNPLVAGEPNIRFYAGVPIRLNSGHNVGTLCVIDRVPRELDERQRAVLRELAQAVARTLEMRREQQEAAHLHQAVERLSQVARRTTNAVIITDAQRRIVWVNEGFVRNTGYPPEDALGQVPGELLQCEQTDPVELQRVREHLNVEKNYRGRLLNRNKFGRDYWVDLEIQPLHDSDGMLTGFMAIETDITEQKLTEQRLAEAVERTQRILEGTNAGTWQHNLVTGERQVDERYATLLGYAPDERRLLTNQPIEQQIHPDDRVPFQASRQAVMEQRSGNYEAEVRMRHRDGHWVWVLIRGSVHPGSISSAPMASGILLDISERKAAEQALLLEREELHAIIDGTQVGTWRWNIETGAMHINRQWAEMLGLTLEDITPATIHTWSERVEPSDLTRANQAVERHFDNEVQIYESEFRMRHRDGHWIWVLARGRVVVHSPDGRPIWMAGTHQDITQRKETEAEIREYAERLRLAAAVALMGVWEITIGSGKVVWDTEMRRLYGADDITGTDTEALRKLWRERVHPDDLAEARQQLVNSLSSGRDYRSEFRIVLPSGQERHMRNAGVVVSDNRGNPMRMIGVAQDVTEQHLLRLELEQQNQELQKATQSAQDASRSKSQFLANMSHEIRTPMNAITGMLALLKKTPLNERQGDYVDKADGATRSLLSLINDILDFSKAEAGKIELDPQPFRLEEMLRDIALILSMNLGHKPVELLFDLDPALPPQVVGDALRLQQVLVNLGSNAIKFTERGAVTFTIHPLRQDDSGVEVAFSVRDSGIGISPENQAKIFTGFIQAETSTTRRFGGTGLGLSICKHLVGLMGGTLALDSAIGEGSTFRFTLHFPLPEGAVPHAPPLAPARNVYQVGASPLVNELLQRHLQLLGHQSTVCTDAMAAQHHLAQAPQAHDTVVVDGSLPRHDVVGLLQGLQQGFDLATWRWVLLLPQGGSEPQYVVHDHLWRFDATLTRTWTPNALSTCLDKAHHLNIDDPGRLPDTDGPRLRGMKVLVVDDNQINQQIAAELLIGEGADVTTANDGLQGVHAFGTPPDASRFDAVLMDMQMPVMDGLEATRVLLLEMNDRCPPVVAMTANAMASDRQACLDAGMVDHIGKPFELQKLVHVLLRVTGHVVPHELETVPSPAVPVPVLLNPDPAEAQLLNPALAIQRIGGQREIYDKLLRQFTKELPQHREALTPLLYPLNSDGLRRWLHTVKGVAATLGLDRLSSLVARREHSLKAGIADFNPETLHHELLSALDEAAEAMTQYLPAEVPPCPAAAPSGPLPQSAREGLATLLGLLGDFDMRSSEVLEKIITSHQGALDAQLAPLQDAVDALDFDEAQRLCTELLDT